MKNKLGYKKWDYTQHEYILMEVGTYSSETDEVNINIDDEDFAKGTYKADDVNWWLPDHTRSGFYLIERKI